MANPSIDFSSPATIMDLPDDCILIIFLKLSDGLDRDSFGLTCRRWLEFQNRNRRSLQFDCSLTKFTLLLSKTPHRIDKHELDMLLNRFRQLHSLSLSGCTDLPDLALKNLQHYGSSLETLCLNCCLKITDVGLSFVADGCCSLSVLSLYRCNISDKGLEALSKSSVRLKYINLSHCSSISDPGISSIVQNCANLCAITITNCRSITGVGFSGCLKNLTWVEAESCELNPDGILSIVGGEGLEYLNISNLSWSIHGDGLAAIGFASNLRVLNLRLCRSIGDASVSAIAEGCPLLVEWNLALCHDVRLAGWESIALNCHNLEKLHVNRCRNLCDRGLQALQNGCKKLSVLYISGCPKVNSYAIEIFRFSRGDVLIKNHESFTTTPSWRRKW